MCFIEQMPNFLYDAQPPAFNLIGQGTKTHSNLKKNVTSRTICFVSMNYFGIRPMNEYEREVLNIYSRRERLIMCEMHAD
jgi:hypothetical protein